MYQRKTNLKLKGVISYLLPNSYLKSTNINTMTRQNSKLNSRNLNQNILFLDKKLSYKYNSNSSSQNKNRSTSKKSIYISYNI